MRGSQFLRRVPQLDELPTQAEPAALQLDLLDDQSPGHRWPAPVLDLAGEVEAITSGEFRLIALGYRWCDNGRGGMIARQPMAVYRAVADRGRAGRIRLVCQRAYDLRSPTRGIAPDPLSNPRGCRDAIFLH